MFIGHINLAAGYRGGERQTQLLVEALSRRGWHQRLIARRGEMLAARCRGIANCEVVESFAGLPWALSALSDIELVHVHQGRSALVGYVNKLFRGTPYLITRRIQKGPRNTWLNRLIYQHAAAIAVLSQAIAESVRRLDQQLQVQVIPDASSRLTTDPSAVRSIRETFGSNFLVGHIGALDDSHKGQLQIIDCARRVRLTMPDLRFLLVGSGRDEAMLKTAAESVDNLEFAGQVENVGDYLAAFDVFIYPSRHEGMGSVLLDALEFGLPIVATRVGGIPEIIEEPDNGALCDVDDIDGLCAALLRLYEDPRERQRIATRNRAKAASFAPDEMAARYEKLYQQLMIPEASESQ